MGAGRGLGEVVFDDSCYITPRFKAIGGGVLVFLVNFSVFTYVIELNMDELPLFTEFKKLAFLSRYGILNVPKIRVFHTYANFRRLNVRTH